MAESLTFEKVWQMFQETDRKFQETDRKIQETDRMVKDLARRFGDLGNRLGEFGEGMVKPAAVRLFQERGIAVHEVHGRTSVTRGQESMEVDFLVVNDTELVAIECKSRLTRDAVEQHLQRLGKLRRLLPKYADMTLYGAVAGIIVDADARELAESQGLFVITQSGDSVIIANPPNFVPTKF